MRRVLRWPFTRPLRNLSRMLAVLALGIPALLFVASPAQAFSPSNGGVYNIREISGNNKCLDVTSAGTTDGTLLQRWDCGPGWNQQFLFIEPSTSTGRLSWKIQPRYLAGKPDKPDESGKCVDAKDGLHGSTPVQIWDCNNGWQQRWVVENVTISDTDYTLHAAYDLNYCLDIPSTQNGWVAHIEPCDGTFGQIFSP
jgi:hypothetical protein